MGPKTLRIDSTLESDLVPPVQNAETMLEHILKDAAGQVTVVWEPGEHEEGCDRTVRLTLTDAGVTRSSDFYDWEFQEDLRLRRKMRKLWDDILVERIKIQRQKVSESLGESGEG